MGSQSDLGVEPDGGQRGRNGREALREALQPGGVEPEVVGSLLRHARRHGPAHHVARGQLVHEPLAPGITQQGAVPPQGLGQQRPGHGGMVQGGGMELDELDVGRGHAGPEGHGHAVTGRLLWVGRDREELAGPAGRQHHVGGAHLHRRAVRGQRSHPDAAPVLDQQIQGEPALQHRTRGGIGGIDQGPFDLSPRGRPAGVHHPGPGMSPFAGQGQRPGGLAVELHPEGDQLMDPGRTLVDQDADGLLVTEPGACGQGVGEVQVGRVLVAAEHGGHAALGPAGGGLGEDALGQHAQRGRRPSRRRQSGQPDGGREAGHPAAQDQDVERSGPDRVVHAGSVRANWASRRADASSITRLRPSTCTTLGVYVASSSRSYSA